MFLERTKLVILAAGKGTRMVSDVPKALFPVSGRPILYHVLKAARGVGAEEVFVVVGHEAQRVKEAFRDEDVSWVVQEEQLGTGHAVMVALKEIGEFEGLILLLGGDSPLVRAGTLKRLLEEHRKSRAKCTVLTAELPERSGYGRIVRGKGKRVTGIVEEANATPGQLKIRECNAGVYVFDARALSESVKRLRRDPKKGEYYLTDVVKMLASRGRGVVGFSLDDASEAIGVNSQEELAIATHWMNQRILRDLMSAGVTVVDPRNTYVECDVEIGNGTVIYPFTVIESDAIIGRDCRVGPFSHLRAGTVLRDGAEIGNYTEVKNSVIGERSRAKHLSYIGDAVIGDDVNVGAGTITANYDGVRKHQTVIESGAHLGSGTILVAPVKVGKGATTGAGAVVTKGKDVADGEIVVGVPARRFRKK